MRLFKLIIFLLVFGILALFVYQNMATFNASHTFVLDLKVRAPIELPLKVYEILLISLGIGFFIGLLTLMKPWLGTRKTLSKVKKEKDTLREKLESYQGFPKPGEEKASEEESPEKSQARVIVPPPPEKAGIKEESSAGNAPADSQEPAEKPENSTEESGTEDARKNSQET